LISNIAHFTRLGKPLPTVPPCCSGTKPGGEISAAWAKINSRFPFLFPGQKNRECEKAALARAILTFFQVGPAGFSGMVFVLLRVAKPSESWYNLKIRRT
jgi:hypothetical protein